MVDVSIPHPTKPATKKRRKSPAFCSSRLRASRGVVTSRKKPRHCFDKLSFSVFQSDLLVPGRNRGRTEEEISRHVKICCTRTVTLPLCYPWSKTVLCQTNLPMILKSFLAKVVDVCKRLQLVIGLKKKSKSQFSTLLKEICILPEC